MRTLLQGWRGIKLYFLSLLVIFAVGFESPSLGSHQPVWKMTDRYKLKKLSLPEISPDGRYTAIVVSSYKKDLNEYHLVDKLAIIDNLTRRIQYINHSSKEVWSPAWSPDGKWLTYWSGQQEKELWITSTKHFRPQRIYKTDKVVFATKWSPDGKKIAFIAEVPPPQKKTDDIFKVVGEDPQGHQYIHVASINHQGKLEGEPQPLSNLNFSLQREYSQAFNWSPDSQKIAFVQEQRPWHGSPSTAINEVDLKTLKITELIPAGDHCTAPHYAPNSKVLAYTKTRFQPSKGPSVSYLCTLHLDDKTQHYFEKEFDHYPIIVGWSPESQHLLFNMPRGLTNVLYSWDLGQKAIKPITQMNNDYVTFMTMNAKGSHIALIKESFHKPIEVYVAEMNPFKLKQVTYLQDPPSLSSIQAEIVHWTSFDGKEIEGILIYPVGYKKGTPVPLVTRLHGGPPWQDFPYYLGESGFIDESLLAANGYAVFLPNYRGSIGYGIAFAESLYKDIGGGDFKDIITGIDALIERGIADPQRLAIGGWSYGGYLTAWAITQTNRFKAAIVGAGFTDLIASVGNADLSLFPENYLGGYYWNNYALYLEKSPIMHINKVKTPTLIIHGEEDKRAPLLNGYSLYYALRRQGIPVKMDVFKGQGHEFGGNTAIIQEETEVLSWLDKYLKSANGPQNDNKTTN